MTKTVTFAYDYLNRWVATEVDATPGTAGGETSEYFVYGGATLLDGVSPWDRAAVDSRDIGQITLRLDDTEKITNRYLWGPAVDQILADEQVDWNAGAHDYDIDQILWPLTDHQGTVRDLAAVNEISGDTEIVNTYSYNAYGVLLTETDATVTHLFGYTGRPSQTDTGLQNNLNRWYDPEIGRFVSEDPIVFRGGDANLARYCGNDPLNCVDPGGLRMPASATDPNGACVHFGPDGTGHFSGSTRQADPETGVEYEVGLGYVEAAIWNFLQSGDPIHLERCPAAQDAIKRGWFNTIVWGMENPAQMSKMLGALPADLGKDQGKRPGPPRSSQSSPKKIVDKKAEAMRAKVKANIQTSREVRTASRKPPGWNHKWKLEPSTRDKAESWRWFDPNGGEWRWHGPDQYHAEGHWDYNPWTSYNSPWQNVPNSQHGQ